MIMTNSENKMFGYNPNRDSGIAPARSYIEIKKTDFPEDAVKEYDIAPTQRYFAQLVYNVGPGGTGGTGGLSAADTENLLWLRENISQIKGVLALTVDLNTIDVEIKPLQTITESDLNSENTVIPVYKTVDGTIEIIEDSQNLDGDIETEFLINVQGFVCGVECHTWIDSSRGVVNQTLERFLPKMTYEPKTTEYPFGLTRIFLSRYEYQLIAELPEQVRKIRIIYQRMPAPAQTSIE